MSLCIKTMLINRNWGSHITYTCDDDDDDDYSIKILYVNFKVCIDGFLQDCRHHIRLDACHLKSKYFGVLLFTNTLDGNNGLLNLAFIVVETKSRNT